MAKLEHFNPASLPSITGVDLLDLRDVWPDHGNPYMLEVANTPGIAVSGEEAQRIAELWRKLPAGDQSRCHLPHFGLRFRAGDKIVCQASICWKCDNIYGDAEGRPVHFAFDSTHAIAQELLALFQARFIEAD